MKKTINIIKLYIFFLLPFTTSGQTWISDTVKFSNKVFITELPDNFKRQIDHNTETVTISYIFPDTSIFSIFYGFNTKLSFYRQEEFDTLLVNSNFVAGTIGQTGKFWKVKKQSDEFIFWYNLVNKEKLKIFDLILESFKWETRKIGE